ncbi:MAG: HAMP domain-containing histidine kinase [Ruminococcaceae bacterium]|nr:HAMP domain-containing histidine kinase [Oscillospiraceae bacterium]
MKLKLFKKYFFTTVIIIVVSIVVLMMIFSVVLNDHITNSSYSTLEKCCDELSESITDLSTDADEQFLAIASPLANVTDADIFIADSHGAVLKCACSQWQQNKKCMHSSYIIPKDVIDRATGDGISEITGLKMYKYPQYVSAKAIGENKEFYVFATLPISQSHDLISQLSKIYYLWAIIPLLFMFVAIYIMTYKLTKPLKSMSEAAKAMAKGDFSKRVPVTSDDEIGELAVSFNMMTNSLSRLESMRRSFVGNVSHELKTPMTTIAGFIDGILDGTIKQEDREYYLGIVSSEVKRLSRLVNGMLSVTRLESGEEVLKKQEFDIYSLLCTIMISQEQRVESKKIEIVGLDSIDPTNVYADKDMLYQVLYNLVDNAIKFVNENGKISFDFRDTQNEIIFTISNTGKGIPQSELPFVFERFYKVDKSRSDVKNSTGLGLYIVKTIVTAHSGKISVMSKENEFTTFKVTIPKENHDGRK